MRAVLARIASRPLPAPLLGGLALLAVMVAFTVSPGTFAPYDPLAFDYNALLSPPSAAHLFGTDQFGRDILSRTIAAAAVDLQIALFATIFPGLLGSLIGLFVGWYGGVADAVFGRLVDLVVTFPFLVLVIAIVAILGPGLANMYIAVTAVGWVFYARLMRGEVLVQKSGEYVAAARVLGYSTPRIIFRHILPNAVRPVLVYAVTDMALAILLGSSLGYLGLGAQPPTAEWGVLIADGKNFFTTAPWIVLFPGAAIVLAGLGFSLTGDGLADLLEVRR
ncbi:ABC transporter permease [Limobrevibacterium gyesilva]|uniref:ABC transporter permease n=1 Tax=Limobrevibacterium gyesilva TaxID=2991712 RepID=A0AA42CGI8_9PROT|nr:ABC transporter permease [Limobrevibacterium gyesilva]MCW3474047.1 ABC transporter permease [Limobrevibacterium gyesilva]